MGQRRLRLFGVFNVPLPIETAAVAEIRQRLIVRVKLYPNMRGAAVYGM